LIRPCFGLEQIGAHGLADAVSQTSEAAPDAILPVMGMDGIDGFATARALKLNLGKDIQCLSH
jgi:hypothetical protein